MGIKLKIFSHHFQVTGVDALANQAVESFSARLVQRHIERDAYGNIVVKAVYVYATRSYVNQQYRFHITLLDEFKQFMFDKNISIDSETIIPIYHPTFADIKMKEGWTPREDQVPVIDYLIQDGYKKVVDAHTGSGKELCNGTPVKTPNGWTNIEDLKIGDLVMGERGEYHKVTGVFPQGKKDLYKFTFKDGRTAIAGAEHLWGIHYKGKYRVYNTKYLIENKPEEGKHYAVPLIKHLSGTYCSYIFKRWLSKFNYNVEGVFVHTTDDYDDALELQALCWRWGSVCTIEYHDGVYVVNTGFCFNKTRCSAVDTKLDIISIEKLDHQEECTCISVDNPTKLFVIKDYVVTHNTVMTLFALAEIKQRVAMVIKPMYIERWLDVFYGKDVALENVSVKDVMIVQGSKNLRSLFYLAQDGLLTSKIIVISNRTLAQYYQYYKENGADDFYANVKPEEMWELLGIGVRLIDEAHQEFHSGFMCDLHTHVPKSIELSGTLNPDDQFLKRMYEIMYPIHLRANTGIMTKYIDIVGLIYGLRDDPKPVKTQRRGKSYYSQAAYEESIFKQPKRMDRLKQMLAELVEELFVAVKLPEHRLLMFFETVDMCTAVADHLKQLYPEYKVSRYTQEEPASTLEENDIIVATPRSAGTAVDISKLQITISFVMRSSSQELQQMVGRLRQLKTDKVNPTYYYLYTTQIPTHNVYSKKLNEVFKLKANSRIERHINYEL